MARVNADESLSVEEAIRRRRSVRGFIDKPVPPEVLREVFDVARRAPSGVNNQPWHVYVASGATRDRIREAMLERAMAGESPSFDFDFLLFAFF